MMDHKVQALLDIDISSAKPVVDADLRKFVKDHNPDFDIVLLFQLIRITRELLKK